MNQFRLFQFGMRLTVPRIKHLNKAQGVVSRQTSQYFCLILEVDVNLKCAWMSRREIQIKREKKMPTFGFQS